ncbi:MAG TPA: S-layer homology domain-containing protein [Chloroflexia bacterium]|nr:S-layer homology domain-containing protein [Chloroflexia bacterium]
MDNGERAKGRKSLWRVAGAAIVRGILLFSIIALADMAYHPEAAPVRAQSATESDKPDGMHDPAGESCVIAGKIVHSPDEAVGFNRLEDLVVIAPNDAWAVGNAAGVPWSADGNVLIEHWDGTEWTIVPTGIEGELYSVDAVSSADVWAVGVSSYDQGLSAIIMHWNGIEWSQWPGDLQTGALSDVMALSANDVWAVGQHILHYDGSAWSVVHSPETSLNALSAVTSDDIWAVGSDGNSPLHWDGLTWSSVPISGSGKLMDVVALATDDVWAVGITSSYRGRGFVIHWDGSSWATVPVPDIPDSQLLSISGVATDDIWAAGVIGIGSNAPIPLTMHWDGTQWSIIPNGQASAGTLRAVSALTDGSVWAVGDKSAGVEGSQTLVMRLDGTEWRVVPSPNPILGYNNLKAVSLVSPTDGWAVGSYQDSTRLYHATAPLTAHWDGIRWTSVPAPQVLNQTYLLDVSALANDDAWAVGFAATGGALGCCGGVIMHWDGTRWNGPLANADARVLQGVMALAADDVWAVGSTMDGPGGMRYGWSIHWDGGSWSSIPISAPSVYELTAIDGVASDDVWSVGVDHWETPHETWILHWNGSEWERVPSPNPGSVMNRLDSIKVIAPDDVWAVGTYSHTRYGGRIPLIMHWGGSAWQVVPGPSLGADTSSLADITATGPNDVWAVGEYKVGGVTRPLALHWDGSLWNVVQSVTPGSGGGFGGVASAAPGYVVAVGGYGSGLAGLTMVQEFGPISFTDVPRANTFYPFVQCLACRSILSGYHDGTFRPNANITRGQIAKIVSNAAGLAERIGGQTFEDVPPSNIFYEHIERMASRGVIGGYPCGGESEPCSTENKPYFRLNANATRGQISKIVSEAKGYTGPSGSQIFEDVPSTNTFYTWVQRLSSKGIMGGYNCGGTSEPCGNGNRPYFRPNNNATRGQTSKIVANAFFPECDTLAEK